MSNLIASIFGTPVDKQTARTYAEGADQYMVAHLERTADELDSVSELHYDDITDIQIALRKGTLQGTARLDAAYRMLLWLALYAPFDKETAYTNVDAALSVVWNDPDYALKYATFVVMTPTSAIYKKLLTMNTKVAASYLKHSLFVVSHGDTVEKDKVEAEFINE